nr:hypothetical protein [Aliamphritea ceti]
MNKRRGYMAAFAAACLTLALGCASVTTFMTGVVTAGTAVSTLKAQGCNALTPSVRAGLVAYIKSKYAAYPDGGICNPNWVRDVLAKKIKQWGEDDAIQDTARPVGYETDTGKPQADNTISPDVSFQTLEYEHNGPSEVRNRFSVSAASRMVADRARRPGNTFSGSDSRLLLFASVPPYDKKDSRSDSIRSNGRSAKPGLEVVALDSLLRRPYWRERELVA